MIEELVYSPQQAAGERIRLVREALHFSRKVLSERYSELSAGTLRKWEEGRFRGLTLKGAEKLQKIFKEEGVEVTLEWLLHGFGQAPSILNKRLLADKLAGLSSHALNHELRVFHQLHKDAISAVVEDDGMAPCLQPGYHVAGTKLSGDDIKKAIGFPSIVHLNKGQTLIRIVEEGKVMLLIAIT
jgi:DNA-binding transcriptional regulator YiaG